MNKKKSGLNRLLSFKTVTASLILLATLITGCSVVGSNTAPNTNADSDKSDKGIITKVVDGDTVKVSINGRVENIRLIGVDTPETVDPRRPVGCYGKEASDFTKALLPKDTEVRLVLDVEPRDRYKRLLAYVYRSSDDLFVNAELARKGYANVLTIPPNIAHAEEFVKLAGEARRQNIGLWKACPEESSNSKK